MSNKKKKLFRIRIKCSHPEYRFKVDTFMVFASNQESAEAMVAKTVLGALKIEGVEGVGYKITLCKEIQYDYIIEAD